VEDGLGKEPKPISNNNKENTGPKKVSQKKPTAAPINIINKVRKRRNVVKAVVPRKAAITDDEISFDIPKVIHVEPHEDDVSTIADEAAETLIRKERPRVQEQPHTVVRSLYRSVSPVKTRAPPSTPTQPLPQPEITAVDVPVLARNILDSASPRKSYNTGVKRMDLETLQDQQMKDATIFVNSVVGKKDEATSMDIDTDILEVKPPLAVKRQSEFNVILFRLFNDNDGELEDDTLLPAINSKYPGEPFTQYELSLFLKQLVTENKVMPSDGLLLSI
jgi:hypothetical protein